jgi:uncharacterized protein (DUF1330 family)
MSSVQVAQAQTARPPAYLVADVDVTDEAAFRAYAATVPDTLKPFNGRNLVRSKPVPKEGAASSRLVVITAFDSLADAEKWYASPAYAALIPERQKAAKAQIYIVEGSPQ